VSKKSGCPIVIVFEKLGLPNWHGLQRDSADPTSPLHVDPCLGSNRNERNHFFLTWMVYLKFYKICTSLKSLFLKWGLVSLFKSSACEDRLNHSEEIQKLAVCFACLVVEKFLCRDQMILLVGWYRLLFGIIPWMGPSWTPILNRHPFLLRITWLNLTSRLFSLNG